MKPSLTVGVPHLGDELHLGRSQRVVGGEGQDGSEEASLTATEPAEGEHPGLPQPPCTRPHSQQRVLRSHDHHLPAVDVVIVHQAGREAFHRVLVQLSKGTNQRDELMRLCAPNMLFPPGCFIYQPPAPPPPKCDFSELIYMFP